MKVSVFLPNWIGDVVMATPALRAIRERYADAEIVGVMRPYVADVLAGLDLIDRNLLHEPRGTDPARRGWAFARDLRRERFDLAVLFPNSLRSGWLARVSGAHERIGYAGNGRGWMLTRALKPKWKAAPTPALDTYRELALASGCVDVSRTMELATTTADAAALDEFWSRQNAANPDRGVISFNPGGAFGAAKHWPIESFAELARRCARELGRTVLVLCGPSERDAAGEIVRQADDQAVVSLADAQLTIGLTKAAIKHSELLVSTDSGPRHFAPPFGVPVVSLFGPTHIAWSHTYYARETSLQLDLDCGPCQQRVCPLGHHRCMRDLRVDMVFNAVERALRQSENAAA